MFGASVLAPDYNSATVFVAQKSTNHYKHSIYIRFQWFSSINCN